MEIDGGFIRIGKIKEIVRLKCLCLYCLYRVYCEYTSGTSGEQVFKTAEERVFHFLARSKRPGWKWMSLRPRSPLQREHHHQYSKQDKEAYFCELRTFLTS